MQRSVDYGGGSLLRGMNIKPSFTDPDITAYKNKHTRRGHALRMCRSNSTVHPPAGDFQRDNCDGLTRLGENLIESLSLLMFKSSTINRCSVFSLCFSVWSAQNNPGTWKLISICVNVAVAGSRAVTVLCAFFFLFPSTVFLMYHSPVNSRHWKSAWVYERCTWTCALGSIIQQRNSHKDFWRSHTLCPCIIVIAVLFMHLLRSQPWVHHLVDHGHKGIVNKPGILLLFLKLKTKPPAAWCTW